MNRFLAKNIIYAMFNYKYIFNIEKIQEIYGLKKEYTKKN